MAKSIKSGDDSQDSTRETMADEEMTDARREGGGDEVDDEGEPPTHLPFAPFAELSGVSTTVDPGYIISLIRKLLPHKAETSFSPRSIAFVEESEVGALESSTKDVSKIEQLGKNGNNDGVSRHDVPLVKEDVWEDCGCIIWDLSANRDHAEFMVDNFLLDVLSMTLPISRSARVTEICLGIIGNLACHDVLGNAIISSAGLVQTVADQLTVNDTACLCELCRLLTVSLQGHNFIPWAEALSPDCVLQRVLWIAQYTLNLQLLEKVMELLLAIINHEQVANILLPSLVKFGLPDLLISLFSCEIFKQRGEHKLGRTSVLDLILQSIEGLSTLDPYSQQISSNKELLNLLSDIVKHPDKDEVGSYFGSSVVIIANILMDKSGLALELFQDIPFFEGLLEILPFIASDLPATGALWSILSVLLLQVQKNAVSPSFLQPYLSALCDKAYLIGDQLDDLAMDGHSEGFVSAKLSLIRISTLFDLWKTMCATVEVSKSSVDDEKVEFLLGCCRKYANFQ